MNEQTDSHFPNIPFFINQRIIRGNQNQIEEWELKNLALLTTIRKQQNQLRIPPDQPIKRTDQGRMGSEYRLTTLNGEEWQIMTEPKIEYYEPSNMSELDLSRLITTLTTKQRLQEPTNREEVQHRKATLFLSANWPRLAKIFYPFTPNLLKEQLLLLLRQTNKSNSKKSFHIPILKSTISSLCII